MPKIIESIALQALTPVQAFILDRSKLNGPAPLGGPNATEWTDLLCDATNVAIRRGGTRADFTGQISVGTMTVTLLDSDTANLYPNTAIRAVYKATGLPVFTGVIVDIDEDIRRIKGKRHRISTVLCVDAVQIIANTMRYGAVVEASAGFENWRKRAARLMKSTDVPYTLPSTDDDQSPQAQRISIPAATTTDRNAELARWTPMPPLVNIATGIYAGNHIRLYASTYERTLTGLIPGMGYTILVNYTQESGIADPTWKMGIKGTADWVSNGVPGVRMLRFFATRTEHELQFILTSGQMALREIWQRLDSDNALFQCSDVVYESTLANHLDITVNTVLARWYCSAKGTITFLSPFPSLTPQASFSDIHETAPGHICFTDIRTSYGTSSVINDIYIDTHGREINQDGQEEALDRTFGPYSDVTSGATWGKRGGRIDTALYSMGSGPTLVAPILLAETLMLQHPSPANTPNQLRVNVTGHETAISKLDIYSPITVTLDASTSTALVSSITHTITPDKWMATLDLMEPNNAT